LSRPFLGNLGFTKLIVRDFQAQVVFYRAVCGYGEGHYVSAPIAGREMEEIVFVRPDGEVELVILSFKEEPHPQPGCVLAGFYTEDLDAFQARVLANGGTIHQAIGPLRMGAVKTRFGYYLDPEGHILEVIEA
jgi:predicted enzyme related to lactoylglutathione lyase